MLRITALLMSVGISTVAVAGAGTLTPIDLTNSGVVAGIGGNDVLTKPYTGLIPNGTPPSGTPVTYSGYVFPKVASVPFDVGTDASGNKVWSASNSIGLTNITLDVGNYVGTSNTSGIYGATNIWTLINSWYSSPGYMGTKLSLSGFDSTGVNPIFETVLLHTGVDYRSIGNSITNANNATPCDVANLGSATLGTNCTGDASETAQTSGVDSNYDANNVSNGIVITVYNNVFTATNADTGATSWLDAQNIFLGASSPFANGWLNTIKITNLNNGPDPLGTGIGAYQKTILSGITVESTPEPGTVLLMFSGLAGVMVIALRRRKSA